MTCGQDQSEHHSVLSVMIRKDALDIRLRIQLNKLVPYAFSTCVGLCSNLVSL